MCSPVANHDLVPSLPNNSKSQAHSRISECDGRSLVHVKPSPINRMVTTSTDLQTDLSKVIYSSHRFATSLNHKAQVYVSPVPDQHAWDIDALKRLFWSHCFCIPSHSSPIQGVLKIGQCNCLIIVIAPG